MDKVTNTSKRPRLEWLMGGNPNAIEAQEAQGQKELVNSSQLPSKVNSPRGVNIEEQYALMGIKVIGKTQGDELFLDVELPNGWKKEATDHSMWNKLVDDNGRERASFFYKAAFYDRDAFVNFSTRYNWNSKYYDEKIENDNVKTAVVKDNATGEILFESEKHTWRNSEEFEKQAKEYLQTNFPDAENINAYWD